MCKGAKSLGKFKSRDQAAQKVLHHLQQSDKHYLELDCAELMLEENGGCIWEEQMENWPDADEGFLEPPPGQDDRSRDHHRRDDHSRSDRGRTTRDRSRSRDNSWNWNKGNEKGRGKGTVARQDAMIRNTTNQVLARGDGDIDEQRSRVVALAKSLGKCEAVIRTVSQVARSAVVAFEELRKLCFLICCASVLQAMCVF